MAKKKVGILTAGGDCPGLNAAMRGIGKACIDFYDMEILGFRDGFKGLLENRLLNFSSKEFSGILTVGGTILGTSRDKPKKIYIDDRTIDMTDVIVKNCLIHKLDVLVCIGGGGTQKNAYQLSQEGVNVITLPKTIDNDVAMTDVTFGFDTALGIATEAIDRLHSTADSHHRIIVVEVMGHKVGWLALGAGIAGGADVILIPEIHYNVKKVAEAIKNRRKQGKPFSIVAIAEGALSSEEWQRKKEGKEIHEKMEDPYRMSHAMILSRQLEELTGIESRVTILGHLQRGGTPSAADRLLATRLGTACAECIYNDLYNVMVAVNGENVKPVPLSEVAGKRKKVPIDHSWIKSAKHVGTCFGD